MIDPYAYKVAHLTKVYNAQTIPANDDISLEIQSGEIFGLLGDNGAGKSTLVGQMAGLITRTAGSIELFGEEIGRDSLYVPLRVGYMPQTGAAMNTMTIHQILYFTAHLRGLSSTEARQERERLIRLWGLDHIRYKPAQKLSGGEARLALLATAMAGSPPILILDEPTNELAPQQRRQVWQVLRNLNREQGTTIIFITHDAIEAERIIQRVGILWNGRLLATGTPAELKRAIDDKLRLELYFDPQRPPQLPDHLQPLEQERGHWLIYLGREDVAATLSQLDMSQLEDFRLYSATLEDLYLQYAQQQS